MKLVDECDGGTLRLRNLANPDGRIEALLAAEGLREGIERRWRRAEAFDDGRVLADRHRNDQEAVASIVLIEVASNAFETVGWRRCRRARGLRQRSLCLQLFCGLLRPS